MTVIPPALADEVAEDCIQQEKEEVFIFEMVKQGHSVDGLFPMNAEWKAKYQEWASSAEGESGD